MVLLTDELDVRNTHRAIDAQAPPARGGRGARDPAAAGEGAALARAATTSTPSSRGGSGSRCGRAASGSSAPTRWAPAAWARTRRPSVADPVGRAARHQGRVDRRRQRVPDGLGHQPDDHDHGARAPHRGGDRRPTAERPPRRKAGRSSEEPLATQTAMALRRRADPGPRQALHRRRVGRSHRVDTIDVVNSSTEEVMGRIPQGTPEDVDRAVRGGARRRSRPGRRPTSWSAPELLGAIAAGLAARSDEIAATIAQELGMPLVQSRR